MPATPTLEQVNAAMEAVKEAMQDITVAPEVQVILSGLSNVLQDIQDAIIEKTLDDLVNTLAADNDELQALNDKINALAGDLGNAAASVQKVAATVGIIASIIGALI